MDFTLKLVIVIGSLLTLFECSRPKKTNVRRWIAALVAGLKRIRQPNDLRRAATSMYLIDKRVKNVVPKVMRLLFSPFRGEGATVRAITTTLGLTAILVPLLILITPPTGMIWMTYLQVAGSGGVVALTATIALMVSGGRSEQVHPDDQGYANFGKKNRLLAIPAAVICIPYGARIASWNPLVLRYVPWHLILSGVLIGSVLLTSLPFYIRHALSLELKDFLYYFSILGFMSILLYFGLIWAFVASCQKVRGMRTPMNILTLWTVSLYALTTLSYACLQTGVISTALPLLTVFLFFLSDLYTIFLFSRLVRAIIFVRRKGLAFSGIILREYVLFVIRTAVVAYLAIVVVLLVQQTFKESVWESALYIFLMYDFADGQWIPAQATLLTHTAFIPLFIILTIPVLMILYRLSLFLVYVLGFNIVKNSNPLAYVAAILFLVAVVTDMFSGLI